MNMQEMLVREEVMGQIDGRSSHTYPEITIIVGTGRSGTTYLARVLKRSMDIGFTAEPKFVAKMYRKLPSFGRLEDPTNLKKLVETIHEQKVFKHLHRVVGIPSKPEEIVTLIKEPSYTGVLYAVFQLLAEKRGQSRLGYKNPTDALHLKLLAQLLPTARFVHIVRDCRDVAFSTLKFNWGPTNLYAGARYWKRVMSIARRDGASLAGRYFEVRFEDLILDTDNVAAKLGEFVNRGTNWPQVEALVREINESKKLDGVEVWKRKMNAKQRYICEAVAGDLMRTYGYETEFDGRAAVSPIKAAYFMGTDFVLKAKNRLTRKSKY